MTRQATICFSIDTLLYEALFNKGKDKVLVVLSCVRCMGGLAIYLHVFLTSTLDKMVSFRYLPPYTREKTPGSVIGVCIEAKFDLNFFEERETSVPAAKRSSVP